MTHDNDVDYYRRREASARSLAEHSTDPQIRRIHLDMADQYATKVQELVIVKLPAAR